MKTETADVVVGIMMIPLALLALLLASRAVDAEMELFGWSLLVFSCAFGFGVIKRHFDAADAKPQAVLELAAVRATARSHGSSTHG